MAKVPEPIKPQKLNGKLSSIAHSAIAQSAIAQSAVRGPVPVPRQRIRRGWLTAAICALSAAAGCTQPVPDSPPKPIAQAVLVCADSDHEIFEELKARFSRFDVSKFAETPECVRARSAAIEIGYSCFEDESSCSTPKFIDGKPLDTPTSAYDMIVLFPQLLYGSLSAKQVTTTHTVTAEGASNVLGANASNSRRPTGRGTTITEHQTINSSETDYTGEVFLFEPRPGLLRPGKRFKNLAAEPLREQLLELLRR